MKTANRASIAIMACMMSLAAIAQSPKQRDAENLARFQHYASPPQDSMHYFRLDRFQSLGPNAQGDDVLAVWTGVNQVYLLTVESPCLRLEYANAIALTSTSGNVNARMDYIRYGRDRQCRIETIRKVDYKAMRAARSSAQPSGGGT
ncbi:MAG TPA: DUF6491 family protein [Rhodanobacteraceae bacterium]|nr:DUF6491 family protein [Rhodanobacteraceae bacterium]